MKSLSILANKIETTERSPPSSCPRACLYLQFTKTVPPPGTYGASQSGLRVFPQAIGHPSRYASDCSSASPGKEDKQQLFKILNKISRTKQKRNTSNCNLIYPKPLNMSKRTEAWTQRRSDLFCINDKYMNVKI